MFEPAFFGVYEISHDLDGIRSEPSIERLMTHFVWGTLLPTLQTINRIRQNYINTKY